MGFIPTGDSPEIFEFTGLAHFDLAIAGDLACTGIPLAVDLKFMLYRDVVPQ